MPSTGSNYYGQQQNNNSNNIAPPDAYQMYREPSAQSHHSMEHQNSIIQQYQQMIREQDAKMKELAEQNQVLRQKCSQLQENYGILSEQYESLKATAVVNQQQADKNQRTHPDILLAERLLLQAKISELEVKNSLLEEK